MDWSKYPLEKVVHYVAAGVPGSTALVVLEMNAPGSFAHFFAIDFLGYRTKVGLILFVAFVLGNVLSILMSIIVGILFAAAARMVDARRSSEKYQRAHAFDPVPWRDPSWRALAKKKLASQAPNDSVMEPRGAYDLRRQFQAALPEQLRTKPLQAMDEERNRLEAEDAAWAFWYQQFQDIVIQEENESFDSMLRTGVAFNLETASAYLLLSAAFVPALRRWWIVVPALGVLLFMALEYAGNLGKVANRWQTLAAQIRLLSRE
jgi:hypothetical protein